MATIKIKQVKSRIKCPAVQKRTLDALGLRKMNQVVEKEDNSQVFRVEMPHHQNFQILQNQVEYSLLAIENLFRN